jgi:hypothetical protein
MATQQGDLFKLHQYPALKKPRKKVKSIFTDTPYQQILDIRAGWQMT